MSWAWQHSCQVREGRFWFLFKVTQSSGLCCAQDDHDKTAPSSPTLPLQFEGIPRSLSPPMEFTGHFKLHFFDPDAHSIPFRFLKISEFEHGLEFSKELWHLWWLSPSVGNKKFCVGVVLQHLRMPNWDKLGSQRMGPLLINCISLGTLPGLGWEHPCPHCSSSKRETRKSCKGSLNMNSGGLSSLKFLKRSEGFLCGTELDRKWHCTIVWGLCFCFQWDNTQKIKQLDLHFGSFRSWGNYFLVEFPSL